MTEYLIYTDSTADLSPALVERMGVKVIPMEFTIADKSYFNYPDNRELDPHDFYDLLRGGSMATTSLINVDRYLSLFEPELQAGHDLLYIAFSSGLSGSFNCAKVAVADLAQKYPDRKIMAVDSLAASMGEGLLVFNAAEHRKAGMTIEELAQWVEENRNHLCHWFTVDDLDHLKRGGRVSPAAAFFGGMLNIKPVLHVDDEGHLIPMQKVRGRRASLEALLAEMEKTVVNPQEQTIFVSHGDSPEDCAYVVDEVKKRFGVKEVFVNAIGPVIGAHSGPGTIALFFLGTHK